MNGFLLDTNVISLFSPSASRAAPAFVGWMSEQERLGGVYLSVVTVHEIEKGIRLLQARGAASKAAGIESFLLGLLKGFSGRILPIDIDVAREGGRLEAKALMAGHNPGASDAMIAGTASIHGLTIVTRNFKHFRPFDVALLSPDDWTA